MLKANLKVVSQQQQQVLKILISINNTRFGRGAAWLLSEPGEAVLDVGGGVVLDVAWQAWSDWNLWQSGQLTDRQYFWRVTSAGVGGLSGGLVGFYIGGFPGAVVGIAVEVAWELAIEPLVIYPLFNLRPKEK